MGKNRKNKLRPVISAREEKAGNRLFMGICIGLALLAVLIIVGFSMT